MRCCVCKHIDPELQEQIRISEEIDKLIKRDKKELKTERKILLLGTGEAGKSTFIKQMRIIHGAGYSDSEKLQFKELIYQNILTAIKALIAAIDLLDIPFGNPSSDEKSTIVYAIDKMDGNFDQVVAHMIDDLWKDPAIQQAYNERRKYQLPDNAKYYLSNISRITAPNYVPTQQDILQSRYATSGIQEYFFPIRKDTFRIVDVGGQRGEREKWLKCFDNVTAVIFIAALSEYDQILAEEKEDNINRLRESLLLFYNITNKVTYFDRSSIILFLNKTDLFEEKIMFSDLVDYFPAYDGPKRDPVSAREFILKMFTNLRRRSSDGQRLYCHYTCATDTENIKFVFASVQDTIFKNIIGDLNLE